MFTGLGFSRESEKITTVPSAVVIVKCHKLLNKRFVCNSNDICSHKYSYGTDRL